MKSLICSLLWLILVAGAGFAQSTNESFPTPVRASEISGAIVSRDIGDSRLTRHFYTFFADNGELDLQIETANFDGDVDVFEAGTQRPLAKITVSAESVSTRTSRIVYFRKRAEVILRIEGRTLSDEAASYKIAFSGSFAAAGDLPDSPAEASDPKIAATANVKTNGKVNSAGAIIEEPKPEVVIEKPTAAVDKPEVKPKTTATTRKPRSPRTAPPKRAATTAPQTETVSDDTETAAIEPPPKTAKVKAPKPVKTAAAKKPKPPKPLKPVEPAEVVPEALANVRLVLQLKNGTQIERPMSEVFNLSIDKTQITVITKNGRIERFRLLDVQKMTIE